jgi:hypothetical protein
VPLEGDYKVPFALEGKRILAGNFSDRSIFGEVGQN